MCAHAYAACCQQCTMILTARHKCHTTSPNKIPTLCLPCRCSTLHSMLFFCSSVLILLKLSSVLILQVGLCSYLIKSAVRLSQQDWDVSIKMSVSVYIAHYHRVPIVQSVQTVAEDTIWARRPQHNVNLCLTALIRNSVTYLSTYLLILLVSWNIGCFAALHLSLECHDCIGSHYHHCFFLLVKLRLTN